MDPGEKGRMPAAMTEDHNENGYVDSNNQTQAPSSHTRTCIAICSMDPGEKGRMPAAMTEDHNENGYVDSNNQTQAPSSHTRTCIAILRTIFNSLREGKVFNKLDLFWQFTYKTSTKSDQVHNGGKRVCLLLMLFMTSIIVVIIFARLMTTGAHAFVKASHQRCTLMFFCILGLLSAIHLIIHRLPDKGGHFISTESKNVSHKVLHKWETRFQLSCIFIFGMAGVIVPDTVIFCMYIMCQSAEVIDIHIAECYMLSKILFSICQFVVLCEYKNYRCNTFASRFSVLLLIPANIGNWLSLLARESIEHIHHANHHEENVTDHSSADESYFDPDDVCITRNVHSLLKDYAFIYYPLAMEFCIITTGLLFEIWKLGSGDGNNAHQADDNASSKISQTSTSSRNQIHTLTCLKICSPTRLLNWMCINKRNRCLCIIPCIAISVCAVLSIAIIASDDIFKEKTVLAYSILYLVIHLVKFIASFVAWIIVYLEETKKTIFGPRQVLLIICTGAVGFWILFELTALSKCINLGDRATLFTADILLLLSVYFQSSLLLKNEFPMDKSLTLIICLSILFILDMYMWIEKSGFTQKLDLKVHVYMNEVYDSMFWTILKLIILPLRIFYSIHVAEMCMLKCAIIYQRRKDDIKTQAHRLET